MRVLVTAASRHGSTAGIAEAITRTLNERGIGADYRPVDQVTSLTGYDAVVLGSAVYAGRWMKPAREFVKSHAGELRQRRVWTFSSGPVGDPPKPVEVSAEVQKQNDDVGAIEHKVFSGKVDPADLSLPERAMVTALHAPTGDYRDFAEVARWASGIAGALGSR